MAIALWIALIVIGITALGVFAVFVLILILEAMDEHRYSR